MAKTISLILGSGGARGYAHIGVIEELLARGFEIKAVAGSSMGALIGGLHAAGQLAHYRKWVQELNYLDVIRLLDVSFRNTGVINGGRIFEMLSDIVGDIRIEDLPIPFTAVATDIAARKEIWFQNGDLMQAIRASIAIPTLFTPVEYNGRMLVDGGVLNPLPIAPVVSAHADLIVAVDLNADACPLMVTCDTSDEQYRQQRIFDRWLGKLNMGSGKTGGGKGEREAAVGKMGLLELLNQSLEVMQESLTRYKMAGYAPDILVPVSRRQCRFYEFNRAEEMIQIGRLAAGHALDKYEKSRATPGSVKAEAPIRTDQDEAQ